MDKRFAMTLAAGTVLALPLLGACGSSTAPQGSSAAPSSSQAPSSAAASPAAAPSTTAADPTPSASASPSSDPAQDKKDVQAATEKFTKAVLTIGYPDKDLDDYLEGIEPLMTKKGFGDVKGNKTLKQQSKALKTLYTQHGRVVPDLDGSPKVSALKADSADAKVTYRVRTQQQRGGDWKTLDTSSKESASIKLVKDGGKWLVDDAG